MLGSLEREKSVDGPNRAGITGPDHHAAATGQWFEPVRDAGAPGLHHRGARNVGRVDETRNLEISSGELPGDRVQMPAYDGDAGRIGGIALQLDRSAVRRIVEPVRR